MSQATLFGPADPPPLAGVDRSAVLSPCGRYRYALERWWDRDRGAALFVMLNPSTADADVDDPTIRRCVNFARGWGYGGITVANLYAWRATKPHELAEADDPVGPENDGWIATLANDARVYLAAWGASPHAAPERIAEVMSMLDHGQPVHCLGRSQDGRPRHPLMLRRDTPLEEYRL